MSKTEQPITSQSTLKIAMESERSTEMLLRQVLSKMLELSQSTKDLSQTQNLEPQELTHNLES